MQKIDPKVQTLILNKESGYNYRSRRHVDWADNYQLYRDKVTTNRLTQRQSVNLPLMKQTIKTLLKDVDDPPVLYFENLDNDKQKEIFYNEYWKWTVDFNKLDIRDIVDKKQVFLFGRSFTQLNVVDGHVELTIVDPQDILVDRYCDPTNIDSSRFLIHTHIYKPLSWLEKNVNYDQKAVAEIKEYFKSKAGLIKAADNLGMYQDKIKKMQDMGVTDVSEPVLGETIVELSIHYVYRDTTGKEELWKVVECEDMKILSEKPLEDIIGETKDDYWATHFPYTSWSDDVEMQDFWSDGIADIVRTPNKVLNAWFSQLVENRTLRNFGMHYYDSSLAATQGWNPTTFKPVPWGWFPVPGKPNEVMQKVEIPDLSESLDEMTFVIQMLEKASGATPTQQGVATERQITLGEVQLALGEAKERIKGMSKFYTPSWKERGYKFIKLLEASGDKLDAIKVYKKGRNTDNIFMREIAPSDWRSEEGYQVKVWSQDEKTENDTNSLQKLNAAKTVMPNNPKLAEIYSRKLLEFAGLTPDETNDVMQLEQQNLQMLASAGMMNPTAGISQQAISPQSPPQTNA